MKKMCLAMVILAICLFFVFGDEGNQEEIDFLLFLPDISDHFVNDERAMIQLDNIAKYLNDRDLAAGQVYIYGYAADVDNGVEPYSLSKDRALFVISELQKRGVSRDLFMEPVGYGAVDLWGNNAEENERSPNRRVRILLEDIILTPAVVQPAEPEVKPIIIEPEEEPIPFVPFTQAETQERKFPWWLLLLLPFLFLPFILRKSKRSKKVEGVKKAPPPPQPVAPPPPPPKTVDKILPITSDEKIKVITEAEIRMYAYGLYEHRAEHGFHEEDWYQSIFELRSFYEARGYKVFLYWEVQ